MKRRRIFPNLEHILRATFFVLAALVGYCVWLWLLMRTGLIASGTPNFIAAALLLAPLLPIAVFDMWLRITWEPELPVLYPPPPTLPERLLQREYGLYWFPVLICMPLWVWTVGLFGLAGFTWLRDFL